MKILTFLRKLKSTSIRGEKWLFTHWKAFRQWQKTPYEVAPLSDQEHDCPTCATHYTGNFCPRCGQWCRIGRYSFRNAFLGFMDIWGLGNRGMFRAIGHLFLRPGFMIRDYLQGRQHAYFPPFKMFFLITTLAILVDSGFNITGHSDIDERREQIERQREEQELEDDIAKIEDIQSKQEKITERIVAHTMVNITSFQYDYPNLFALSVLLFVSGFLFLLFRKAPNFEGGMHYSELIVSLVYLYNMLSLYTIPMEFLQFHETIQSMPYLLIPIVFSQLTGYSILRSIAYTLLTILFYVILIILIVIISIVCIIAFTAL